MSFEEKKQRRGSKAPELLTSVVNKLPPSHEWLMNLATFPTLVASMLYLKHAFLDGRCSLTTKRAGEKLPSDANSSYTCCRNLASFVVKSSPFSQEKKKKYQYLSVGTYLVHPAGYTHMNIQEIICRNMLINLIDRTVSQYSRGQAREIGNVLNKYHMVEVDYNIGVLARAIILGEKNEQQQLKAIHEQQLQRYGQTL